MKQNWRDITDGIGALSVPVVLVWAVFAYLGGPLIGALAVVCTIVLLAAWLFWPRYS